MTGVTVQVGPRSAGRRCAAWGRAVARNRFMTLLVVAALVFEGALAAVMLTLGAMVPHGQVPVIFTPPPSYFCPAGQHVTGVDPTGWPVCAPGSR